ncbi:MAG: Fic family protein [Clostridiales bacterium]|jgi:Fic family protein|nr:Fic family protein [Clostridiales bacterium]
MSYGSVVENWQKMPITSVGELDGALTDFKVAFAYNSSKIENPRISYGELREIFAKGKIACFSGELKTLFEELGHKSCYDALAAHIVRREPLSTDLLRLIHYELTKTPYDEARLLIYNEAPGEFRKCGGENSYGAAPPPASPESEMAELCEKMNGAQADDILKAACYLHAAFLKARPFADANGRVGRTLMNYYLMTHGHPPIIVHESDKRGYYKALDAFNDTGSPDELCAFMRGQCEKTWTKPAI